MGLQVSTLGSGVNASAANVGRGLATVGAGVSSGVSSIGITTISIGGRGLTTVGAGVSSGVSSIGNTTVSIGGSIQSTLSGGSPQWGSSSSRAVDKSRVAGIASCSVENPSSTEGSVANV